MRFVLLFFRVLLQFVDDASSVCVCDVEEVDDVIRSHVMLLFLMFFSQILSGHVDVEVEVGGGAIC